MPGSFRIFRQDHIPASNFGCVTHASDPEAAPQRAGVEVVYLPVCRAVAA